MKEGKAAMGNFELRSSPQTGMGYVIPQAWSNGDSSRQAIRTLHPPNYGLSNHVYSPNTLYPAHHSYGDHAECISDDDNNFTFSSVADALDFFTVSSCTGDAKDMQVNGACSRPFCMSPADELFEDGKIRPLVSHNQPNHILNVPSISSRHPHDENRLIISGTHQGLDKGKGSISHESEIHQKAINPFDQGVERSQLNVSAGYGVFPLDSVSLSAPASPVGSGGCLETSHKNESDEAVYSPSSFPSTTHLNSYKRSRSLSRVHHFKDDEKVLELHVEEGIRGRLQQRRTLQDLMKQEENPPISPRKKKPGVPNPKEAGANDTTKRPFLAPAPINIPQPWPKTEKPLASPPTNHDEKRATMATSHGIHHYTSSKRTRAERMKKKTFLPYRPVLLGCLGYPQ